MRRGARDEIMLVLATTPRQSVHSSPRTSMLATISLAVAAALVPPAIRKTPAPASIAIACGDAFDDRLRWLLSLCDRIVVVTTFSR